MFSSCSTSMRMLNIQNRIEILKSRKKDNSKIIAKLERELRKLSLSV